MRNESDLEPVVEMAVDAARGGDMGPVALHIGVLAALGRAVRAAQAVIWAAVAAVESEDAAGDVAVVKDRRSVREILGWLGWFVHLRHLPRPNSPDSL